MDVSLLPVAKVTSVSALAPKNAANAAGPMDVTPAGMVMAVRALAPENALSPMDVTPSGMEMAVRALAFENAYAPMDVSLLPAAKVTVARLLA
jgi:hypothetical protein